MRFTLAVCLATLFLHGCAAGIRGETARAHLARLSASPPGPSDFGYCHGHGCSNLVATGLTPAEWAEIRGLFVPAAAEPAGERARIARAVGRFETFVGARLGTSDDRGRTFGGYGRNGQLDCVDEAANTTVLLHILDAAHLLRWHDVGVPETRGSLLWDWPHTAATIAERRTGRRYTVDSWFFDNGEDAVVVPLEDWLADWQPEQGA